MSYNKGQGSFGQLPGRGNIWAMLRQLIDGQGGNNPSDQVGGAAAGVIKVTYDFAVDGGAIATFNLFNSIIVPAGAIVYGGLIDVVTTLASGGGATVAIGFGTGAQSAALKGATGFGGFTAGSIIALIPVWTAASAVKVAADTKVSVTIAAATLTAGKFAVQLYYHMNGE